MISSPIFGTLISRANSDFNLSASSDDFGSSPWWIKISLPKTDSSL